jgi:hypothetical protein
VSIYVADYAQEKSATFTDPFRQSLGEANFKTLQATQMYHDRITRADHVLQGNISVLDQLAEETEKRRTLQKGTNNNQYELLMTTIQDVKRQLQSARRHLSLIQARLDRITEAVSLTDRNEACCPLRMVDTRLYSPKIITPCRN